MKKVQDILQWGKNIGNLDLLIESDDMKFLVKFDRNVLPHLLGLHYINSPINDIKGIRLFNKIRKEKLSDEDIYNMITKNHPDQLDNVKNRIQYFKEFMYHLDKAEIVEVTNPQTKIKSHHLILQSENARFLQLGIASGIMNDYFETFLVSSNDVYFKNTTIKEKISGIYKYDDECNLIPFSFNPEKAKKLEREYNEQKERENEQSDDKEIKASYSASGMDEDEWDFEI